MTYTNLYFYTNFNNHGFLVEKLYSESNKTLQAALLNTQVSQQCVSKGHKCAFEVYVDNYRPGGIVDMRNLTNVCISEGKSEFSGYRGMRKKYPQSPILFNTVL